MSVFLGKGELLACLHAIQEVGMARLRIRKLVDDVLHVRDGAFEALVDLSVGAFDVRHLAGALETFALEDDLAAVGIGVGDAPPDTDCVRVLHRSINFHLHGEGVVLPEEVLDRVDVVLSHIAESAGLIIPLPVQ